MHNVQKPTHNWILCFSKFLTGGSSRLHSYLQLSIRRGILLYYCFYSAWNWVPQGAVSYKHCSAISRPLVSLHYSITELGWLGQLSPATWPGPSVAAKGSLPQTLVLCSKRREESLVQLMPIGSLLRVLLYKVWTTGLHHHHLGARQPGRVLAPPQTS